MSTKLRQIEGSDGASLAYWCQGCDSPHVLNVAEDGRPRWTWNGDRDAPTFTPSVLATMETPRRKFVCHTFITDGQAQFLTDCTHEFAGQTLPIPDWPYADGEYGGVERLGAAGVR